MASVVVSNHSSIDEGSFKLTDRAVVRSSSGTVYALWWKTITGNNVAFSIAKGNSVHHPTSFSDTDSPSGNGIMTASMAIDSEDIIHVLATRWDSAAHGAQHDARHYTYHTVDAATNPDTWQVNELIANTTHAAGNQIGQGCAIAVDVNDDVHVVYHDNITNMGTDYDTAY